MRSVHPFKWDVLEHQSQTTKNFKLKIFPVSQKKKKEKKEKKTDHRFSNEKVLVTSTNHGWTIGTKRVTEEEDLKNTWI